MRVILYALLAAICVVSASYTEKLTIIPKTSKTTILSFAFKTQLQSFSKNNILLHKHIHQLIDTFDLKKLHLTQTQGRWDYKKNDRLDDLYNNLDAPTGVMLVAWLKDDQNIDKNWKGLVNALSGMFCASLNFLDNLVTVEPKFTKFEPDQKRNYTGYALRYATLPRELVCTENLSPWVKLLPCQTKSGIASIFNPYKLYDSNFHSLSTTIEKVSPKPSSVNTGIVFSQTLTVVTDPSRLQSSHDGWSLSALFEKKITKTCPLAHHSSVVVKKAQAPFDQKFVLDAVADKISDNGDYIFDLSERSDFDLSLKWKEMAASVFPQSFHFHRYFTGHGQERGGLLVELSNPTSKSMDIILFQMIPWYLKFYMHTLTVECKDQESDVWRVCDGIITKTYYQCAIPRTRPTIIEQLITLPSKTTTRLHVDFDKAFIKYTEHPPDSNRGFDVSAAIVTHGHKRYFSRNLLIHLATPDFSMPYNVITLSCTVLALLAGGMYNLLIRDFKPIVFEKTK